MQSSLSSQARVYKNLSPEELIQISLERKEGVLASNGALSVSTGKWTGRSPKDRFIVKDSLSEKTVNWGVINQPIDPKSFEKIWKKAEDYLSKRDVFESAHRVGAHPKYNLSVTVRTDLAWQSLFAHDLFINGEHPEPSLDQGWTILSATGLALEGEKDGVKSDVGVILNFSDRKILICGTQYAGEMKKSMFSALNFMLPDYDVLPMHCSANIGNDGTVAIFFGLSGTGKTTLSADPERRLIGDDEHGWGEDGIFNFEGGCYAKCINLSQEKEPLIWNALRSGAVMENVILNPKTLDPDYTDSSRTENTRAAYPIDYIEQRADPSRGGHPKQVIFLTCDLFGVLPPVARLTKEQAAYYFLSGYTALVGSTEMGHGNAIQPTFSMCFGAPFFSRPASVYANLLTQKLDQTGADVFLVNTGWHSGAYGEGGERFSIPMTRRIVQAILNDELRSATYEHYDGFNVSVPISLSGLDRNLLNPRLAWSDQEKYTQTMNQLIQLFQDNFTKFPEAQTITASGPVLIP